MHNLLSLQSVQPHRQTDIQWTLNLEKLCFLFQWNYNKNRGTYSQNYLPQKATLNIKKYRHKLLSYLVVKNKKQICKNKQGWQHPRERSSETVWQMNINSCRVSKLYIQNINIQV